MTNAPIQCEYCGKFISHADIENGKAKYYFIPDSEVSTEFIGHVCKRCNKGAEQ